MNKEYKWREDAQEHRWFLYSIIVVRYRFFSHTIFSFGGLWNMYRILFSNHSRKYMILVLNHRSNWYKPSSLNNLHVQVCIRFKIEIFLSSQSLFCVFNFSLCWCSSSMYEPHPNNHIIFPSIHLAKVMQWEVRRKTGQTSKVENYVKKNKLCILHISNFSNV